MKESATLFVLSMLSICSCATAEPTIVPEYETISGSTDLGGYI